MAIQDENPGHDGLASELGALLAGPEAPTGGDRALRAELRAHAGRIRWRRLWRRTSAVTAAAASLVFVAILALHEETPEPVQGDVTGDGRVDVRDAYVLQRRLERGDATVSASDVRKIMDRIVAVGEKR